MQDISTSLSLLQRVRDRNDEAWNRLYYLYAPLVEHWCRQQWKVSGADADDLRQEIFQAVAAAVGTFRRDRPGDTFRGWLWVIARRKFLDFCRRKGRQPEAQGGSDANLRLQQIPEAEESDDASSDQVKQLHRRALELIRGQFEESTWQAFWRCAVEEQSPADVGRDMNMTAAAVRKAKSRVLRRLKDEMGELLS